MVWSKQLRVLSAGTITLSDSPAWFSTRFFQTGDLCLGDADHVGYLGLGLAFEKAQGDNVTFSVIQTFHGIAGGEMFHPGLFHGGLFQISPCQCIPGIDRLVLANAEEPFLLYRKQNDSNKLHANPKAELCAFKGGEWIRVATISSFTHEPKVIKF